MAESSLSLGFPELKAEVGQFLGYSRTSGNWSAAQLVEIEEIVHSGCRQFYYPPLLPGMPPHKWTFLEINTTLVTVADDYDYTLPDSFGSMIGDFTFATTDNVRGPIKQVGEGEIRALREADDCSGQPVYCAIRARSSTGTTGQRWEAIFFPTPDAVYTLGYRYKVLMDKLSTGNPYPLGGMVHAETILESCLAVAEERMDDESNLHVRKFQERLMASVQQDREKTPDYFGRNGDSSHRRGLSRLSERHVTYNGTLYEG